MSFHYQKKKNKDSKMRRMFVYIYTNRNKKSSREEACSKRDYNVTFTSPLSLTMAFQEGTLIAVSVEVVT